MSNYQPFVGEHAEYYRRRTLRDAVTLHSQTDAVLLENHYLRQRVAELESQIEQEPIQLSQPLPRGGLIKKFIEWLKTLQGKAS